MVRTRSPWGNGQLFRKTRNGKPYGNWLVRLYDADGTRQCRSTGTKVKTEAQIIRRQWLSDKDRGEGRTRDAGNLKYEQIRELFVAEKVGTKAWPRTRTCLLHLDPFFQGYRVVHMKRSELRRYVQHRQDEGAAASTIKNELMALSRMFNLAMEDDLVQRVPSFKRLIKVQNAREVYWDDEEFGAVYAELPKRCRGIYEFSFLTGWRIGAEVIPLNWSRVDFKEETVTLLDSKNDDPRVFPFDALPRLKQLLLEQRTNSISCGLTPVGEHPVFHYRNGKRVKDPRAAFKKACERAGIPYGRTVPGGKVPHDFRRTAARRLEWAGVPRSTAKKLTGHRTDEMYNRYTGVSRHDDLREGVRRAAALVPSRG